MAGHRIHNRTQPLGQILYDRTPPNNTSKWLCEQTGIYVRTMTDYLAGRRDPVPADLTAICEALDVTPEDLQFKPVRKVIHL